MLETHHLYFSYKESQEILSDISLRFESEKLTAILGPNGTGKTTLLKQIAKALTRSEESVKDRAKIDGLKISKLR